MKRRATAIVVAALALGASMITISGVRRESTCGPGFSRSGARCLPGSTCPAPLVSTPKGCDEPEHDVVAIPKTTLVIGPSDWEAQGKVAARTITAGPFSIDRFEVSVGRFGGATEKADAARAASAMTRDEARAFCKQRNGRLPTEDEWIVAAAGEKPRRYPWGDTGAVCRRAAFGLAKGPCAQGADGPDSVGAHPDGQTPLGVHDLAGNVAEWIEVEPPAVRGGAWDTELATELRTWTRRPVPADARAKTIGFRCAYDALP